MDHMINILEHTERIGIVIFFFYKRLKKAGTVSSMAGGSDLGYFSKDHIIVTVQSQRFDILQMAGSQTLGPQFLAASLLQ